MPGLPLDRLAEVLRRLGPLVLWEARAHVRSRLQVAASVSAALVVALLAWRLSSGDAVAALLPRYDPLLGALFLLTPFRDPVLQLPQLAFGYALLRWTVTGMVIVSRITLPVVAASAVAAERKTGRMQELQLTLFPGWAIYFAKVIAATLPVLVPGLALFLLFSGVALSTGVSAGEMLRLLLEMGGQVLLVACVSVSLSALFRSPQAAWVAACCVLWVLLPLGWSGLRALVTGSLASFLAATEGREISFVTWYLLQTAVIVTVCGLAAVVGIRRLRPD